MCDAMVAGSRKAVPEMSSGSSAGSDEDYATRKGVFLRRAAFRISWLLVFVLRNASTSATPLDLTYGAGSMTISRLVTESDCLTSERRLKSVCGGARLYFGPSR
jgi:hypothetical protein